MCRYCGTELPPSAMFCGECGRSVGQVQAQVPAQVPAPAPSFVAEPPRVSAVILEPPAVRPPENRPVQLASPVAEPAPNFMRESQQFASEHDDLESTRIVARDQQGDRFVLQFSTGESHVVSGSGLVGRNPSPEPGEQFTHRISIADSGKSVSKTHLEFGQSAGAFWISDRFSGNGTEIRQPNADPLRCDPGKRYLLTRGSRIDIGDQFFVVS